jgi:hypothetical protein
MRVVKRTLIYTAAAELEPIGSPLDRHESFYRRLALKRFFVDNQKQRQALKLQMITEISKRLSLSRQSLLYIHPHEFFEFLFLIFIRLFIAVLRYS